MNPLPKPFDQAMRTAIAILSDQWHTPLNGGPDHVHLWAICEAYCHHTVATIIKHMNPDTIDWQAVTAATGTLNQQEVEAAYGLNDPEPPF